MAGSGFRIASAYVDVHLDRDALSGEMAELDQQLQSDTDRIGHSSGETINRTIGDGADGKGIGKRIGDDVDSELQPRSEQSGRDSGDKMSRAMQQSASNNSPLIVAAIAGGLAAGAPVVLAGAGVLFAGIAAAAVHSNADLAATFHSTLNNVEGMFVQAAQVTVPMFQQALTRIGAAVVTLGPQFHAAFAALGGPIDSLTTGLIRMTQNVMPGLVSAVQSSGPVFQGLAKLMADIGTGLSQFFSIIAQHSTAAGQVFAALGSIIQSLLPILAQFIGAGAELAAQILPPISAALHVLADSLNYLAPILPTLLAGLLAFKAVSAVSGYFTNVSEAAGGLQKALGGFASSLPGFANGMTAIGTVLGVVAAAYMYSESKARSWGQAILDGGNAATQAYQQMGNPSFWDKFIYNLGHFGNTQKVANAEMQDASAKAQAMYAAMSPLEQKQQDVTKATNDLQKVLADPDHTVGQAVDASATLKEKQDALTQAQAQLDQATKGVTQAMLDMANQALAAADSGIAYRQAQVQAGEAAKTFQQALAAGTTHLNDNTQASLQYEQALLRQAEAAGKAAADASGLTDKMQLQKVSDQAVLAELLNLKAEYGANFPASLQATIDKLQATGINLDQVGEKKPTPTLDLNTGPFDGKKAQADGDMSNLAGQRPTPVANLDTNPLQTQTNFSLGQLYNLGAQRPTPIATLIAQGLQEAENAIDIVARPRSVALYTYVASTNGGPAAAGSPGAIGGAIADIAQRAPIVKKMAFGGTVGGRLFGPGGPTDDLIPAMSESGAALLLSNREFVVTAAVADQQGDRKMNLLNSGQADIVPRGSRSDSGNGVVIQRLEFHLHGTDFTDTAALRKAALVLEQELIKVGRERK